MVRTTGELLSPPPFPAEMSTGSAHHGSITVKSESHQRSYTLFFKQTNKTTLLSLITIQGATNNRHKQNSAMLQFLHTTPQGIFISKLGKIKSPVEVEKLPDS